MYIVYTNIHKRLTLCFHMYIFDKKKCFIYFICQSLIRKIVYVLLNNLLLLTIFTVFLHYSLIKIISTGGLESYARRVYTTI